MGFASSIHDGRTRYGRNANRTPNVHQLWITKEQRPAPAFADGQRVVTPRGVLVVQRKYYSAAADCTGWRYIFKFQPKPTKLANGVELWGRPFEINFSERELLPLQLAAVPPVSPPPPPVGIATPEPDMPDWGAAIEVWVRDLLGVGTWV